MTTGRTSTCWGAPMSTATITKSIDSCGHDGDADGVIYTTQGCTNDRQMKLF